MRELASLDVLSKIAAEAASVINEVYATSFDVEYKSPRDPVTLADRRANELICRRLREHFPDVPVVAEESDPKSYADFRSAERVFFVDPLDGTREFVKRTGAFVVMIGLLERERPRAGVLYAPARDELWIGVVGGGAAHESPSQSRHPLRVSAETALSKARIVSTRSHRSDALVRVLAALGAQRVDALGSAGLKCAEVAAGLAEAYVAPGWAGSRWDLCAGQAIIEAAGGRVTDAWGDAVDFRDPDLGNKRGIVASNGHVHEQILERLAGARESA